MDDVAVRNREVGAEASSPAGSSGSPRTRPWLHDLLGILWVLGAAGAVMLPTLIHGASLGPFDVLSRSGLSKQAGVVIHNRYINDQIDAIIPWTALAWTQVHHGYLPLWNPYSALGMPLAFNWQSATFSVPALLGYLVPLRLDYTVQALATLVIAGSGVYVLGRVLRIGVLGSTMAATVYELSGPFLAWLGWPYATTMSWLGWLVAAVLVLIRGRHRVRDSCLVAVIIACVIYSGQPEALILFGLCLLLFLVVLLVQRVPLLGGSGPVLRPALDISVATAAGLALGAPLLLPGLQLLVGSRRSAVERLPPLAAHDLVHILFQGYNGLPMSSSVWFDTTIYQTNAALVGVIAVVLAVAAAAMRRKRPEIVALAVVAVVTSLLVFAPPVSWLFSILPGIGNVNTDRALIPMAFAVAVLAGGGLDLLAGSFGRRNVRMVAGLGFVAAGVVIALLWLFGRDDLSPVQAHVRAESFWWPLVETVAGLLTVGGLALVVRRRRMSQTPGSRWPHWGRAGALVLLACVTGSLIAAGAPLWSSSTTFLAPTPAVTTLQKTVGTSLVGFGTQACVVGRSSLGILQDTNIAFGVTELAAYDPIIPSTYFPPEGKHKPKFKFPSAAYVFCPAIRTVAEAKRYGVSFVLEPRGSRGPVGAVFVRTVDDEEVFRIPGAARATLTPAVDGRLPASNAPGAPVTVSNSSPSRWKLTTAATSPQVLRLRLTDVPGWQATIDGRPLPLIPYSRVMLQARIPPGRHVVVLQYWPDAFTAGIVIAVCSVAAMSLAGVVGYRRRRSGEAGNAPRVT